MDSSNLGKGLDLNSDRISACKRFDNDRNLDSDRSIFVLVSSQNSKYFSNSDLIVVDGTTYAMGETSLALGLKLGAPLLRVDNILTIDGDVTKVAIETSKVKLDTPASLDEYVYFSLPSTEIEPNSPTTDYQRLVLTRELSRLGYRALPTIRSHALVLEEGEQFENTAIGIVFGMGMIDVAVVQDKGLLTSFSTNRAGDWIEEQTALQMNVDVPIISQARRDFDPTNVKTDADKALRAYYRRAMDAVLSTLSSRLTSLGITTGNFPMIWTGAMTSVKSFADLARERFNDRKLITPFPVSVSEQFVSKKGFEAVVLGLCKQAVLEYGPILPDEPFGVEDELIINTNPPSDKKIAVEEHEDLHRFSW